jgi:hypothetical protein
VNALKPSVAAVAAFGVCLWHLACVTGLRCGSALPGMSMGTSVGFLAVRLALSVFSLSD